LFVASASGMISVANKHLKPAFSRPILNPPAPEKRDINVGLLFFTANYKLDSYINPQNE
jgi:hypothetical protein